MTRTLVLMRHAKSDWASPELADHARPLNRRGEKAAAALGAWLRAKDIRPDVVLCSSARRTVQTCEGLGLEVQPTLLDALYEAGPEDMLQVLRQATGECVLMLAHNPGIGALAARLLAEEPEHLEFDAYPTGATLVAGFDADWRDLAPQTGRLLQFTIPRELPEA